jgi:hypothetical protein
MLSLILVPVVSFLSGGGAGWVLSQQGITAENALQHHQKQVYRISCILLGLGVLFVILGRSPWMLSLPLLLVGGYSWEAAIAIASFAAGFLLLLELPGWSNRQRRTQLLTFLVVSLAAVAFLSYQRWPILHLLQAPQLSQKVVLQTTPYSCSAASIATLTHWLTPPRSVTEREVVQLAGTSRHGTSTLAEIHAMQALDLKPEFVRNLTLQELVNRWQFAVLHVMEPVEGTRIAHAIALLGIDPDKQTLTVGNPLYGQQVKSFAEMNDYWLKEAVFVTTQPMPGKTAGDRPQR